MNNNIIELASQAYVLCKKIDDEGKEVVLTDQWHEKFAELIVQKCVDICIEQETSDFVKNTEAHNVQYAAGYETGCSHCEVMIKQHFGIK